MGTAMVNPSTSELVAVLRDGSAAIRQAKQTRKKLKDKYAIPEAALESSLSYGAEEISQLYYECVRDDERFSDFDDVAQREMRAIKEDAIEVKGAIKYGMDPKKGVKDPEKLQERVSKIVQAAKKVMEQYRLRLFRQATQTARMMRSNQTAWTQSHSSEPNVYNSLGDYRTQQDDRPTPTDLNLNQLSIEENIVPPALSPHHPSDIRHIPGSNNVRPARAFSESQSTLGTSNASQSRTNSMIAYGSNTDLVKSSSGLAEDMLPVGVEQSSHSYQHNSRRDSATSHSGTSISDTVTIQQHSVTSVVSNPSSPKMTHFLKPLSKQTSPTSPAPTSSPTNSRSRSIAKSSIEYVPGRAIKGAPSKANDWWGFCEGAWAMQIDDPKAIKIGTISLGARYHRRYIECSTSGCRFQGVHMTGSPKIPSIDMRVYMHPATGIRFRWAFLMKSHKRCTDYDLGKGIHPFKQLYACLFCVAESIWSENLRGLDTLMNHILRFHTEDENRMSELTMNRNNVIFGRLAIDEEAFDINIPRGYQEKIKADSRVGTVGDALSPTELGDGLRRMPEMEG